MLHIIGIGLGNEKDITVHGLEIVKKAEKVYLESYTSSMQCSVSDLEKFYNRKVIQATREDIENNSGKIIEEAKAKDIVILVIGSPTAATTHINFLLECKKHNIEVEFIENASVLTAIGITGLFLYKFGRVITIPFENEDIETVWDNYLINKKAKLHTLFLLDIQKDRMMACKEALGYLIKKGLSKNTKVVCCAALGSKKQMIKYGKASEISVGGFPQCLIVPSELNFV